MKIYTVCEWNKNTMYYIIKREHKGSLKWFLVQSWSLHKKSERKEFRFFDLTDIYECMREFYKS